MARAAAPDAAATAAALVKEPRPGTPVRLRDRTVFTLHRGWAGRSVEERARAAGAALEHACESDAAPDVRVEERGGVAIIFAGPTPVVQLHPEDAVAAGDASLAVHAALVSTRVNEAVRGERRRRAIAATVFSASLLVFSALMALLLLRKGTDILDRARSWILNHPQRIPALRVLSLDLVRPPAVRATLAISLGLARALAQLGIAYLWLLFALSLFEPTRDLGTRLTSFVLSPISALLARIGGAVPLLIIGLLGALGVLMLMRFVSLFFDAVARGDATINLVPRDLARPTGLLVRGALLVVALLFAAPLITGSDVGSLSRVGVAALATLGLACVPTVAGVIAGLATLYGRRLRVGDHVERSGRAGLVTAVTLTEVRLVDEHGAELRLPHLGALVSPTRVATHTPPASITVVVASSAKQSDVRALLLSCAQKFGPTGQVELEHLDAEGARYRVTAPLRLHPGDPDLATVVAEALVEAGVPLGKAAPR